MCVHVHALPEECLLIVFDQISLMELLCLDQVCYRWAFLLPSATARRRTLVLNIGERKMDKFYLIIPVNDHMTIPTDGRAPYYDLPVVEREAACTLANMLPKRPNISFDQFLADGYDKSEGFLDALYRPDGPEHTEMARFRDAHLNGQLVTYLTNLLPNVDTLVVMDPHCFEEDLHSLVGLLGSWPLVTLKLWMQTRDIDERYVQNRDHHPIGTILLPSINSLRPSLRQLTLDISGRYKKDDDVRVHEYTFPMESFAFIAQLKVVKLALLSYDSHNMIWNSVHRFDNANLEQIVIGTWYSLEAALNRQFEFTTKVRQLYARYMEIESVQQLGELCLRYSSLTMLQLYWTDDITFRQLVTKLASLQQLTHLEMYIDFEGHPRDAFADLDEGVEEPLRQISLPQVKILKFAIMKRTHQEFNSLRPEVFPSLEVVILEKIRQFEPEMECIDCLQTELTELCHQRLLRSLRYRVTTNPSVRFYPAPAPVSTFERSLNVCHLFIKFFLTVCYYIAILPFLLYILPDA